MKGPAPAPGQILPTSTSVISHEADIRQWAGGPGTLLGFDIRDFLDETNYVFYSCIAML